MKKVLIADDTKNIRTLLTTCMEIEGYEVTSVTDGLQALDLLTTKDFNLVFLDIKMPQLSGTEVLKKIREMKIETPVIIMTAFATVKNAVECTRLGAVAYLQKPFTVDKVKAVLEEIKGFLAQKFDNEECIRNIEAFISESKFDEAFILLKKVISIEPTNPKIYYLFGKVYEGTGDIINAQKFNKTFELFNINC